VFQYLPDGGTVRDKRNRIRLAEALAQAIN